MIVNAATTSLLPNFQASWPDNVPYASDWVSPWARAGVVGPNLVHLGLGQWAQSHISHLAHSPKRLGATP